MMMPHFVTHFLIIVTIQALDPRNLSQKPLWDNVVAVSLTNACKKLKLNTKAIKYS
uniref:Uncharacterized protein n=1 Tax=Anguilla anguilla TaxID=7936 RepID=A0A0E9X0J8_ANGAN